MRSIRRALLAAGLLALPVVALPCGAQDAAFGIGARISRVHSDNGADTPAERFTGGQIRARVSPSAAFEVSIDLRRETSADGAERTRDLPVQASLLLYSARGSFAPYLIGGAGWYSHRIEALAGDAVTASETTRRFGWHGGLGVELRFGRRAGLHGDYRYTFLHYGSDSDTTPAAAMSIAATAEAPATHALGSRLLPKHDGSMWTAGFTVYF